MSSDNCLTKDVPEVPELMAAVIRLMAKCAHEYDAARASTLLKLINELRAHPDLPRRPAVLAGLAEAHSIWLQRVNHIAELQANHFTGTVIGDHKHKLH